MRQEGKVIFPVWWAAFAISLVMSLQRLQTQAQETKFLRLGQRSSEASTRWMISPRSSGSMEDQEDSPCIRSPLPPGWPASSSTSEAATRAIPPAAFGSLCDDLEENFRERNDLRRDMALVLGLSLTSWRRWRGRERTVFRERKHREEDENEIAEKEGERGMIQRQGCETRGNALEQRDQCGSCDGAFVTVMWV